MCKKMKLWLSIFLPLFILLALNACGVTTGFSEGTKNSRLPDQNDWNIVPGYTDRARMILNGRLHNSSDEPSRKREFQVLRLLNNTLTNARR
jgi:hypothetical protein